MTTTKSAAGVCYQRARLSCLSCCLSELTGGFLGENDMKLKVSLPLRSRPLGDLFPSPSTLQVLDEAHRNMSANRPASVRDRVRVRVGLDRNPRGRGAVTLACKGKELRISGNQISKSECTSTVESPGAFNSLSQVRLTCTRAGPHQRTGRQRRACRSVNSQKHPLLLHLLSLATFLRTTRQRAGNCRVEEQAPPWIE
jgi:hypothetical protein